LVIEAEEGSDRVLFEPYTLFDLVGCSVDMVKGIAADNSVDVLFFALTQAVDWSVCLVNCLWLTI
jgi:hypothetical protein